MKRIMPVAMLGGLLAATAAGAAADTALPQFVDLFNGRDLSGWVNVNTAPDTWKVRDGLLICAGHPIGVMRSEKQYENFVLHIEWMHMEPGGNSGVFVWSNAKPDPVERLPNGVEVQMLELAWPSLHKENGVEPPVAYVHGELFGVGGVQTTPDNPRGERSKSIENRCKGRGEWNTYDVVAVDGVIKLSVNGKFVNGIMRSTQKKGYLCLESEGAEIHFRNISIMELPPGVTSAEQTAPEVR
jgi:3-keto-disaccharide hydrolase